MADKHSHLIIVRAVGSAFTVRIEPPIEGEDLNGVFDNYKNARGWAGGIRMTRGFKLIDEVEASQ